MCIQPVAIRIQASHAYVRHFCRQQLLLLCARAPGVLPPKAAAAAASHTPAELPWPCLSVEPLPLGIDALEAARAGRQADGLGIGALLGGPRVHSLTRLSTTAYSTHFELDRSAP